MSDFRIKSGGTTYDIWHDSCRIKKSMFNITNEFAVITDNIFEKNISDWDIKMDSACELIFNDKTIITGYIDEINIIYDIDGHYFEIKGRDKTCDLVDCNFIIAPNEWKKLSIGNIIKRLCSPFNIDVEIDDNIADQANGQISTFKADEGEFISDIIQRLCRDNAIMPMSYGDGKLTLTKATETKKTEDDIQLGANALLATVRQSNTDRYSNYTVKGYGIGNDNKSLVDFINPVGTQEDSGVGRYRSYMIFSENATDNQKCLDRAKWEASIRAGLSGIIEYKIDGWFQSNGDLWDINTLVKIKDEFINLSKTMLIVEIDYVFNEEDGYCSFIKVVDRNTFNLNNVIDFNLGFESA